MKNISPAYVAGLVDGEGCITIESSRGRFFYQRVYLGMSEKALPLLRLVQESYGGCLKRTRKETYRWSAAWMLTVTGKQATPLLLEMAPHLILKEEQCRLALQMAELVESRQGCEYGGRWDAETVRAARELQKRMRVLNRKGPAVPVGV